MSLIKVQSNEDNYRRDSFSDRVCDDLSEVILQYLSLKDRLRLECVSKQFQRTALLSQRSLDYQMFSKIRDNFEAVKHFLKKIPNLTQISVVFSLAENDLIELIIKYCNHLTHIQIVFNRFRANEYEVERRLFDKFGHQLISLRFDDRYQNIYFGLTKATNISELTVRSFDSKLSQIKFNRLKKFCVKNLLTEDLNSFELFIENNAKTLKHLDITSRRNYNNENIERFLKIISKSINLVHLSIYFDFKVLDKSLTDYWKEIAINCKQIKSLKFQPNVYNNEMFSILKQFKRLKRLDLDFCVETNLGHYYNKYHFENLRPFQEIIGLEGLTHLKFRFYVENHCFSEAILTDIDINFPKLQSLRFVFPFIASEWTAQVLSRLSSLETIALRIRNPEITPHIERQLIEKCKKFKKFTNLYSSLRKLL